mgnify:CR=1 FL=1
MYQYETMLAYTATESNEMAQKAAARNKGQRKKALSFEKQNRKDRLMSA